jgi:hypothetical protein
MNSKKPNNIIIVMMILSIVVFTISFILLIIGDYLEQTFNVIGIRVATLFVAFSSFCSSTLFSLLILLHNKTVSKINDDNNQRAELFRELQFASTNYSIIEFMDRMLIYDESQRYIDRFLKRRTMDYHMMEANIPEEDIYNNPLKYSFISIRIPFRVVEGKMVSSITFTKLKFEREDQIYEFYSGSGLEESKVFILYNEQTKRNNVIINLITPIGSSFFNKKDVNIFSKIKIYINITSLLGVEVRGISELYFTNPEQIEGDGTNTYRINSSNFGLLAMPIVTKKYPENGKSS